MQSVFLLVAALNAASGIKKNASGISILKLYRCNAFYVSMNFFFSPEINARNVHENK